MVQITVQVDGMVCNMCESHINDVVRKNLTVKKVTSSYKKGQTVIISEQDIPDTRLRDVIDGTGYETGSITREPYEKKGFSLFKK